MCLTFVTYVNTGFKLPYSIYRFAGRASKTAITLVCVHLIYYSNCHYNKYCPNIGKKINILQRPMVCVGFSGKAAYQFCFVLNFCVHILSYVGRVAQSV